MNIEITPARIQRICTGLDLLLTRASEFLKASGHSAAPNSMGAKELAAHPDPERLHSVHCLAGLLIEVSADHLAAFPKTITEPATTVAPWNCIRALLESSALAAWFLDTTVDGHERIARSLAHRFEGLIEQSRFSASAGLPINGIQKRIEKVEAEAIALGYEKVADRRGRRVGIAAKMPTATKLIGDIHKQEEFYRLLSAMAHGHFWAIQQLSFPVVAGKKVQPAADGVSLNVLKKGLSLSGMAMLGSISAEAFARPLWSQCLYFGWDKARLAAFFDESFDRIGLSDKGRFWRAGAPEPAL